MPIQLPPSHQKRSLTAASRTASIRGNRRPSAGFERTGSTNRRGRRWLSRLNCLRPLFVPELTEVFHKPGVKVDVRYEREKVRFEPCFRKGVAGSLCYRGLAFELSMSEKIIQASPGARRKVRVNLPVSPGWLP